MSQDRARFEVVGHVRAARNTFSALACSGHSRAPAAMSILDVQAELTPAQKFADLSEFGYGVALLNDCKYGRSSTREVRTDSSGYAAEGNILRISLLRGPTYPDPEQDQGEHRFSLAVYPHRHHFMASDVPAVARAFNSPLHMRRSPKPRATAAAPGLSQFFRLETPTSVVLDTIKRGEDDDFLSASSSAPETVILRLYESMGGASTAVINLGGVKVAKAGIVDILERPVAPLLDVPDFSQLAPGQAGICRGAVEDGEPVKILLCVGVSLSGTARSPSWAPSYADKYALTHDRHFRAFEVKTVKLVLPSGSSKMLDDNSV